MNTNYFIVSILICVACNAAVLVGSSVEPTQKWNYVEVRKDAHMFWWVYFSTAAEGFASKPLVLWLQGGPGGSSTGFGNFQEIGPLDVNLKPRNTTWLSSASLLFIDNPVGTGYSYVTSDDAYTTNVDEIASDLLAVMKSFLAQLPQFSKVPFYIFSESYGGKMTASFSEVLYKAIQEGSIKCNFKGFAMGDSWISPIDSMLTWGPYLYATSLVDREGLAAINIVAMSTKQAIDNKQFAEATKLWNDAENIVEKYTHGVNFYNILKWGPAQKLEIKYQSAIESLFHRHVSKLYGKSLSELMNGPIRKKLAIIPSNVTWGAQSQMVFEKQSGDFMKPVIDTVDRMLNKGDIKVVIYSGQLDLIVDTLGTEEWVQKLRWPGLHLYNTAERRKIVGKVTDKNVAFVKSYKNFYFYWVLDSGHMVPQDVGDTALQMLNMIIAD
ncbi:Retinoid-inducible serine carboxypeptidase [Lamellibrachia satsuma]|nr:Retinoid-inducible serine carboxypeptidase [Lamellibrachia satsuma]